MCLWALYIGIATALPLIEVAALFCFGENQLTLLSFLGYPVHRSFSRWTGMCVFYSPGWWLSMKPEDDFLKKLQPLAARSHLVLDDGERFGKYNDKTIGFLLVRCPYAVVYYMTTRLVMCRTSWLPVFARVPYYVPIPCNVCMSSISDPGVQWYGGSPSQRSCLVRPFHGPRRCASATSWSISIAWQSIKRLPLG